MIIDQYTVVLAEHDCLLKHVDDFLHREGSLIVLRVQGALGRIPLDKLEAVWLCQDLQSDRLLTMGLVAAEGLDALDQLRCPCLPEDDSCVPLCPYSGLMVDHCEGRRRALKHDPPG